MEINSGKIITIISSEIFAVERGFVNFPLAFVSPLLNIACYCFLGIIAGWWFALGVFVFWILLIIMVNFLSIF
jgi:ABC-type siderophore export system fused ATPase/permease subunit